MIEKPRIGIAGLLHESNTFATPSTTYEDFARTSLTRGEDLLKRWSGAHHEIGGFIAQSRDEGFEIVPLFATFAVPSGMITADAFEHLAMNLTTPIKASLPLDGVLLALHGATVAEQFPDADGEILSRVRALLGPDVTVVNTLDLHANISPKMIQCANATVVYRSNPHLDQEERGKEAARLLARTLRGEIRPVQAVETPPMIVQMSCQYTSQDPARRLYRRIEEVSQWPGIVSASTAMGFYFADVQELGASFVAVANGDPALARKAAHFLAERAWEERHELVGHLPSPAEAVRAAGAAGRMPVVLMDTGDNVGGGAPGDSTILFAEVLRQKVPNALVILHDPESVKQCLTAGPGKTVELMVGGKTDRQHGDPVRVRGRVRTLNDGHFIETQVRHGGWGQCDQGITAAVETPEQHTVILTSRRMAPMSLEQILSLGIHPERKRVIIIKGVVAPRAAYEPIAAKIIVTDTPGVTSDNPQNFQYKRRRFPLYPLEPDAQFFSEAD